MTGSEVKMTSLRRRVTSVARDHFDLLVLSGISVVVAALLIGISLAYPDLTPIPHGFP